MNPQDNDPYQFHIPKSSPSEPPKDDNNGQDGATSFARAKIDSIFNEPAASQTSQTSPNPAFQPTTTEEDTVSQQTPISFQQPPANPVVYQPEQLYAQETALQDQLQPNTHHTAPDHQLSADQHSVQSQFGTFALGQAATENTAHIVPPDSLHSNMSGNSQPLSRAEQIKQFAAGKADKAKQTTAGGKGKFLRPFIKSAIVTSLVFLIYNAPLVVGQAHYYITPANSEATPIILDETAASDVSEDPRLIISKLNIDVPVVFDEPSWEEARIQKALERGIVHYGTTAMPGELGNSVLLGHSSASPWAPGRYKTAFSILRRLEVNDTFVVHYKGQRYIYEVYNRRVIDPADFSVIDQRVSEPIVTLITCDPPGSNWRRLAIQARQISPNPSQAQPTNERGSGQEVDNVLPGSPPSLYDRLREWIF